MMKVLFIHYRKQKNLGQHLIRKSLSQSQDWLWLFTFIISHSCILFLFGYKGKLSVSFSLAVPYKWTPLESLLAFWWKTEPFSLILPAYHFVLIFQYCLNNIRVYYWLWVVAEQTNLKTDSSAQPQNSDSLLCWYEDVVWIISEALWEDARTEFQP